MEIFDAHLHIIDPRFPLVENHGYLPPDFTVADYIAARPAGITGGAIVSGSFQAMATAYLVDALKQLGPTFVGVTNLAAMASDADILALDAAGVRAVRFNLFRGGSEKLDALDRLARRVHDLAGWHIELYADAADIGDIAPTLKALPQIVVDHLGLSAVGLPVLLDLVAHGAKVKATGFGRLSFDIPEVLRAITAVDPTALMFGTDLPSTRAPRPFLLPDIDVVMDSLGETNGSLALFGNACQLYIKRHLAKAEKQA